MAEQEPSSYFEAKAKMERDFLRRKDRAQEVVNQLRHQTRFEGANRFQKEMLLRYLAEGK